MDVEGSEPRHVQYSGGNDESIRGDHDRVRLGCCDPGGRTGIAKVGWLENGQAPILCQALDCSRCRTHPASRGPIGLRQNQRDRMAGAEQRVERLRGEFRSAGED